MYNPNENIYNENIEFQEIQENHSAEILEELKSIRRWTALIGSYILIKIVLWIAIFILKGSIILDLLDKIAKLTSLI